MKSSILLTVCVLLSALCIGQNTIVPSGTAVSVDGHFSVQEWSDAQQVNFPISAGYSTQVYFKHDANNLYVAFAGNLQTAGFYFPEIMIDANYSRSTSLEADDWWFHVSATDCEYQGAYGNYANCQVVRPNWTAAPNFQSGQVLDTVEIEIPLSTIMVNQHDTIGIAFLLNNFQVIKSYPDTANHLNPSTWIRAVLDISTALPKQEQLNESLALFPNPTRGQINFELKKGMNRLLLYDLLGQELENRMILADAGSYQLNLDDYPPGIYFLKVLGKEKSYTSKLVKK